MYELKKAIEKLVTLWDEQSTILNGYELGKAIYHLEETYKPVKDRL